MNFSKRIALLLALVCIASYCRGLYFITTCYYSGLHQHREPLRQHLPQQLRSVDNTGMPG